MFAIMSALLQRSIVWLVVSWLSLSLSAQPDAIQADFFPADILPYGSMILPHPDGQHGMMLLFSKKDHLIAHLLGPSGQVGPPQTV